MRATLTIDLAAIASNWRRLDALSSPQTETGAVVKADAYGLGMDRVVPTLWNAGARQFFVAQAEEGAALRALVPEATIYVFSGLMPGDTALFQQAELIPLLNSPAQLKRFRDTMPAGRYGLQLDSGMNRLGFEPGQLDMRLDHAPALVMSHLACADEPGHPNNQAQLTDFEAMTSQIARAPLSLAATGGVMLGAAFHHDLTRPGIGLYGGRPFVDAQSVVSLDLPVIQTRQVAAGEWVGYGADWTANRPSRVATVAAGYADGLFRCLGGAGTMWSADTPCPIVGRISMDLITVDVTALPDAPAVLNLLGPNQGIDDLAAQAGTIGYEVLTSLGARYERVYKGAE